jgi:hypothetical protein
MEVRLGAGSADVSSAMSAKREQAFGRMAVGMLRA